MWLGTEDGCIHVYNCTDNIRTKRNKIKIQLSANVNSIIYLNDRVYAGLGNGQLVCFRRDYAGDSLPVWLTADPSIFELASTPILKLLPIGHKVWCAVQNHVKVFNATTHEVEISFHVSIDASRVIHTLVSSGLGVWVSTQSSPIIRLYHATTYECLLDVNVAPAVSKILAGLSLSLFASTHQSAHLLVLFSLSHLLCLHRLRRHHPTAQGSLFARDCSADVQGPPVDRHVCRRRLDPSAASLDGQHIQIRDATRRHRYTCALSFP